ncbi:MAG: ABC transporter ATP-binding protein [Gammaproteobacteria bacterium]|nr:ABC transporter ATP-binding protein [Gammaproteobacteria bacterium]
MLEPCINIKNLTILYDSHPAIHHLTVGFYAGRTIAITGPNGAGKSSLVKAIVGKIPHYLGTIEIKPSRVQIGYLPQVQNLNPQFPVRVIDFVAMGFWSKLGMFKRISTQDKEKLQHIFFQLNLGGFENRQVNELSMGQWQRVLIARLILQDPDILILDEPFNAMDNPSIEQFLGILQNWKIQKKLILTILHDYQLIHNHFELTMLIARELISYGDTKDVLTTKNIEKMRHMSEAWDATAPFCEIPN